LLRASTQAQVIVTSHSPDLLDDPDLPSAAVLAVVSEGGETKIGPLDTASYEAIRTKLYSAGELLRLNQLAPNRDFLKAQEDNQRDLFGDAAR
jgi:predicted ATPase